MAQRSGINRALMWLRKTLEITEETESPQVLSETVRPVIDVFGWERLAEGQILQTAAAATGEVLSGAPAAGIIRLVLHCSVLLTGSGVGVTAIMRKRNLTSGAHVGLPLDRESMEDDEVTSMIGHTFLVEGDAIVAAYVNPPAGGTSTLSLSVIDLPVGEYIPYI